MARGRGHVRLKGDKAWTLLTTAQELKGFEEKKGRKRWNGTDHGVYTGRKNWLEEKQENEATLGYLEAALCAHHRRRPGRACARRAAEAVRRADHHRR